MVELFEWSAWPLHVSATVNDEHSLRMPGKPKFDKVGYRGVFFDCGSRKKKCPGRRKTKPTKRAVPRTALKDAKNSEICKSVLERAKTESTRSRFKQPLNSFILVTSLARLQTINQFTCSPHARLHLIIHTLISSLVFSSKQTDSHSHSDNHASTLMIQRP